MLGRQRRWISIGAFGLMAFVVGACTESETPLPSDANTADTGTSGGSGGASQTSTNVGGTAGGTGGEAGGAAGRAGGDGAVDEDVDGGGKDAETKDATTDGDASSRTIDGDATDPDASADATTPPLDICLRITAPTAESFDVTIAFEHAVYVDCRLKWITRLYLDLDQRAEYLNGLIAWNLNLWGCTGTAVGDFPLLYKPAHLTQAEADLVVEDYIDAANVSLAMSPDETQKMRAALRALAQPSVDATAQGFPHATCPEAGLEGGPDGGALDAGDNATDGDPAEESGP